MKTVLFVPGFKESLESHDYKPLLGMIKESGYKVKFVPIAWQRTTIKHWVKELEDIYSKYDSRNTILAGFSFGAMTAFMAATKRNPYELWLFSLSPYFNEDIHSATMRKTWLRHIGHRRVSAFDELHFKDLAKNIRCKTLIFAGEVEITEWSGMKARILEAGRHIHRSNITIVENTGHDVLNKHYVHAIKQVLQRTVMNQ